MNFEKLLKEKKIERVEKSDFSAELAEKDIAFAKAGMKTGNYDRVMAVAYEAALRAGSQLANFLGYRAIGAEHHKNLFMFLGGTKINKDLIDYFDRIRKKRNDFLYRDVESVSKEEAGEIITNAEHFVQEIRTIVQEIRTGEKR